jgi:phosphoribosylformylglycinamidine synthase subunit PurQ / glutaminase
MEPDLQKNSLGEKGRGGNGRMNKRRTNLRKRVFVLYARGTNCEEETMEAIRLAGGDPHLLMLEDVYYKRSRITDCDAFVVPGGFSFGDDVETGVIVATLLEEHLPLLREFNIPTLGICNGDQILVRAGLLGPDIAMVQNKSGVFCSRPIRHRVLASNCVWTNRLEGEILTFPSAHGFGLFAGKGKMYIVMVYEGLSPNGGKVAMITDESGIVAVIMNHPERRPDNPDGQKIFRAGLRAA